MLNPEEYIDSTDCEKDKIFFSKLFSLIPSMVKNINKVYKKNMDIPEILIKTEDVPNAMTNFGSVIITTGMMDYFKQLKYVPFSSFFPATQFPDAACGKTVVFSGFYWLMYHELFHLIFEHEEIIKQQDDPIVASLACEYDADLCAIAMVYRQLETAFVKEYNLNKPHLCQIVIYSVYWFIRNIQVLGKETDHPSVERRLCSLMHKIASLKSPIGTESDYGLAEDDSRKAIYGMTHFIRLIEEMFSEPGLISGFEGDAVQEILRVSKEEREGSTAGKEWLRIFRESRIPLT